MGADPTPAKTGGRRCPHCHAVLVPAGPAAITCKEQKTQTERAYYAAKAARGECVVRRCSVAPAAGHVYCPPHLEALNARTRKAKARARKKARKRKKRVASKRSMI